MSLLNEKKKWTEDEVRYLRENYPTMDTKELVEKLNRSWSSVTKKAQRLGLKKAKETLSKIKVISAQAYDIALKNIERIKSEVALKDLYYIAGFFDAEGSLTVDKRRDKRRNLKLRLQTTITNNDRRILEWIKSTIKLGKVYPHYEKENKCWVYRLNGWQAYTFIVSILPYLKIKHEETLIKLSRWVNQYEEVIKNQSLVTFV